MLKCYQNDQNVTADFGGGMHRMGVQTIWRLKKRAAYGVCSFLLALGGVLGLPAIVAAAPAYTPYANSVATQSGGVSSPANAVGAPDGQNATLAGANTSITLDMGDGEEGTNTLQIYFGPVNLQAQVRVEFLNDNSTVITSQTRTLFTDLDASVQPFAYDWQDFDAAYRYVRVTAVLSLALGIDSVEALGFIGSSPTQDTDGDGTPDRQDGDPLVFNPKGDDDDDDDGGSGNNNSTNNSDSSTSRAVRKDIVSRRTDSSVPVNPPASGSNDKDGDQMDDAWERRHKLDPTNPADAQEDTDRDDLVNVREYEFDTNPRRWDTENDGIPDGWEVSHGLNAKVVDAEEDPDFDYITNRGEYFFDSNPYVADDFHKLAAKLDNSARMMSWALLALLLLLLLLALWQAHRMVRRLKRPKSGKHKGPDSKKSSLPPL